MTKFKIGDKVKIVDSIYVGVGDVGSIGEVTLVKSHGARVNVNGYEYNIGSSSNGEKFCYFYLNEHLELIDDEIKVGDKVRIVSKGLSRSGEIHNGEIVTVKEIAINELYNKPEKYAMIEEYGTHGIWLNELEKVEDEKRIDVTKKDDDPNLEVNKRTLIEIKDGTNSISFTTNSKKNRVSLFQNGALVGRVKTFNIDSFIGLLEKLKEEI